jgi:hypothetical protein
MYGPTCPLRIPLLAEQFFKFFIQCSGSGSVAFFKVRGSATLFFVTYRNQIFTFY